MKYEYDNLSNVTPLDLFLPALRKFGARKFLLNLFDKRYLNKELKTLN